MLQTSQRRRSYDELFLTYENDSFIQVEEANEISNRIEILPNKASFRKCFTLRVLINRGSQEFCPLCNDMPIFVFFQNLNRHSDNRENEKEIPLL